MDYGQGVGFLPRESIPADHTAKEPRETLAVEQFLREAARLVRDAAETEPERLNPDETVDDPGVGSRPATGLLGVPALEERERALEERRFRGAVERRR